ncbi:MAG: DegT/DnrJ/EryC1/StrS family aminotransferase [Bacilli bacterium]
MIDNFKIGLISMISINVVSDVLRSGKVNHWTGNKNIELESKICAATSAKYAITLANGSLALELALVAAGVSDGDEVITCRTFMASASSAVMKAVPVVVDVDLNSQNILPEAIEKAITPKTKAIAVHHAGSMRHGCHIGDCETTWDFL